MTNPTPQMIEIDHVLKTIVICRAHKVMLSSDLADLYGVTTGHLNRAVRRNQERFPPDFMFQLKIQEVKNLICHSGISSSAYGGTRHLPYAFTEQGIAMLSSVLNSPRAITVNIEIMRAFLRMREMLSSNTELARKLEELERKVESHDQAIVGIFKALREIMTPPQTRAIGFTANLDVKR